MTPADTFFLTIGVMGGAFLGIAIIGGIGNLVFHIMEGRKRGPGRIA
jgi:hypothetical protein